MDFFRISSSFIQLTPDWVATRLGLQPDEKAERFALEQAFAVLLKEFEKDGKDPVSTRKETVDFMVQHMKPRYDLYQKYAPTHFPFHEQDRHDAMVLALLCDSCLAHINPHSVPEGFDRNLVFTAYDMYRQQHEILEQGGTSGPLMPESLFLAQIEALGDLDIIRSYLPQYRMAEIQKHTSALINYAHLVDASTPVGRDLYGRLMEVSEKIEFRISKAPDLALIHGL